MRLGKKATKMYKENVIATKGLTSTTAMLIHDIIDDYVIWSLSFSEYCYKSKLIYKGDSVHFRGWGMTNSMNEFIKI